MAIRKEKILDKLVKKDYNNDLEEVLTKKAFSEEAKNLLLDSLYKTENAYRDYETVKINVPTIDEYIQNIIQSVSKSCDNIKIIKPKIGEKPTFSIDKENKKIECFPSAKQILYALVKIQKHDDIVKVEPDFINYALTNVLNTGNCINSVEAIRDFNGFSWSPSLDIENFYCNLIYQDLNILSNYKLVEEWIDKNDDLIDYMELIKSDLEKKYSKQFQKELFELLKIISILMLIKEDKTYKAKMVKRKKDVQNELIAMEDKISYIETISKYKRQLTEKIRKIDIILSDKEKLLKEYEKRNKGLPLSKKIFSKKVLRSILEKEREEILLELKKCNDKLSSKKFVKVKKEYEYQYEYLKLVEIKDIDKIIEEKILFLQKRVLQALKIRTKNAINREEINRIIYELRYFLMLSIDTKTKILEVPNLKRMITTTLSVVIDKAYELKDFKEIFRDKSKNINIIKYIFNLKIIKLEDIAFKIIKEKEGVYVQFFDDDVLDEKIELDNPITKEDLKIRFNKKIKLFDL